MKMESLVVMATTLLGWFLWSVPAVYSSTLVPTESAVVDNVTVVMTTEAPPLKLIHKESKTGSIVIEWELEDNLTIERLTVKSQRVGEEYLRHSPELNVTLREYEIPDLVVDSTYSVCVVAMVTHNETHSGELEDCLELFTIPYIRLDSLLALIIVVLVLFLLVLFGFLCWRHAHRKQQANNDSSSENQEAIAKKSESTQPILLAPPPEGRPRSSIEDEDIPYITPPLEELEQDERDNAIKAMRHTPEA